METSLPVPHCDCDFDSDDVGCDGRKVVVVSWGSMRRPIACWKLLLASVTQMVPYDGWTGMDKCRSLWWKCRLFVMLIQRDAAIPFRGKSKRRKVTKKWWRLLGAKRILLVCCWLILCRNLVGLVGKGKERFDWCIWMGTLGVDVFGLMYLDVM